MITIKKRYEQDVIINDPFNPTESISDTCSLPFAKRQISRQRLLLGSGREAALMLPRGSLLRGGEHLISVDGDIIEVIAAPERVSIVTAENQQALAKAAYHLGNRHVSVQVGEDWIAYLHDHVLDDMILGLQGLAITQSEQAFEPEAGAYHGKHAHQHRHGSDDDVGQNSGHSHAH